LTLAQSKDLTRIINVFGKTVAIITAIGAMFGALNSMYSAVAARGLEIATLRAIGFGAFPVLLSVTVTRTLIITGVVWACVIGLLGGFFPALRAARLPVAEALRAA
jgi:putative ABC transport system permease protein